MENVKNARKMLETKNLGDLSQARPDSLGPFLVQPVKKIMKQKRKRQPKSTRPISHPSVLRT